MKKKSRFLTGLLSAVMALSLCALPAMAEGTTSASTFDPSITTGTLTINKYEQTKEEENLGQKGTPLDGVEFTIYQLATVKQGKNTDGSIGLEYTPTINELASINFDGDTDPTTGKIDSKELYNQISSKILPNVKNKLVEKNLTHSATTGADGAAHGQAKFNDLPLGIYMVEETKAPSQILSYTANFIVSIPMMDDDKQTWNYNVVADPKNVPTYGGVKLVKTGRVAGAADDGTGLAGVLFRLDIKGADNSWTPVDLDAKNVTFDEGTSAQNSNDITTNGYIKTGDGGVISITGGLAPATYRFVELEAVDGYIADAATAHEFEVYFDKTANELRIKEDGAEVDAVKVINERPDLEKNITKRDDSTSKTHDADYGIGDKVPYTLKIKVPNTINNLNTFKVTDTVQAEQLIYSDDFKVFVTKKGETEEVLLDDKYYKKTLTNNDGNTVAGERSVEFDFRSTATGKIALDAGYADAVIKIEYTAKLLDGAVIGNEGNINKAKLTYSNKTNVDADNKPTNPKNNESNDAGVVYTFQTGIKKVDQNNKPLNGVKFDLYKKVETTDEVSTDGKGIIFNGVLKEYVDDTKVKALNLSSNSSEKWVKITDVVSGAKDSTNNPTGEAIVKGLPNGTYKFVETETLKGYNLLKDPVDATLSIAYSAKWEESNVYDTNGQLIKRTYSTTEKAFNNEDMKNYTVINRKGFTLPVTGGFGTLLFSAIGALLVVGGVGVLMSTKKKKGNG